VQQFIRHTPVREYLAVVRGHLRLAEGTLVHYFRQEGMFQKATTQSDPKSARAELRYSVEHRLKGASLVRVSLVTGLQNQIRVQLSAIGHPVIGDKKYHPSEKLERQITRVALHAARLWLMAPDEQRYPSKRIFPPRRDPPTLKGFEAGLWSKAG
jgi:23S rRNA pseudouridine1911/1915/1917 synthase